MLGVVQDGEQHVEVAQRLGEGEGAGLQGQAYVTGVAPVGELRVQWYGLGGDRPAERLEQPADQVGAAACGQHGHLDAQRQRGAHELRTGGAHAAHGAGEDGAEGDGEE